MLPATAAIAAAVPVIVVTFAALTATLVIPSIVVKSLAAEVASPAAMTIV